MDSANEQTKQVCHFGHLWPWFNVGQVQSSSRSTQIDVRSAIFVSLARAITIVNSVSFATISGTFQFIVLSTIEPTVMIICTCLPVMRPLFKFIATKIGLSSWISQTYSRTRKSSPHHKSETPFSDDAEALTSTPSRNGSDPAQNVITRATTTEQSYSQAGRKNKGFAGDSWGYGDVYAPMVETRIQAREMDAFPVKPQAARPPRSAQISRALR